MGRSSESKLKVDKVILNKDQKERPALNIEGKSKLIDRMRRRFMRRVGQWRIHGDGMGHCVNRKLVWSTLSTPST